MTVTRILVLKGYTNPFGEARTKPRGKTMRKQSAKVKAQQSKMKSCARQWKAAGKPGKWSSYAGKCLKK